MRAVRAVALATSVALVVTLADVPVWTAAPAVAKPKPAAPRCPDERPDQVSALVTARLCNKKIAVSGLTSETTTVFANPSGTVTADVAGGPVRFRDGDRWVGIDLTLKRDPDGKVRPKAHPKGLVFAGTKPAGAGALATVNAADDTLSMDWVGALTEPVLDGARATYRDVKQGMDLVVEATPAGFEQFLVVKDRSAAVQARTLSLPLRSSRLRFAQDAGGVAIKDAAGKPVGRVPTPVAWDATTTPDGLRANEKPLTLSTVRPNGKARVPGAAGADSEARAAAGDNAVELRLSVDPAWLDSPATTYPVTLDPAVTVGPIFDTYIREGDGVNRAGYSDLQLGWGNGPSGQAFLQWDTAGFAGARIRNARLNFFNFYSGRCDLAQWEMWTTDAYDMNVPMYWWNKPAVRHLESTSMETKGYNSSCNDGWVGIDAAGFLQRAANTGASVGYMGIKATNESTIHGAKSFRSSNNAAHLVPHMTVEYDAAPVVSNLATSPATAGCVSGDNRPSITSTTPRLRATVADADTSNVTVTFEWAQVGGAVIGSQTVAGVASNTVPSVMVPAGAFVDGGLYGWRVRATDGVHTSPSLAWCEFRVDTTKPGVPFVSSTLYPSITTDNSWGHGGAGQAGQFTISPAEGTNDLAAFVYQLDTDTAQTTVAATGPATVTVTPTEDGRRTLTVRAKDKGGLLSEPHSYAFNVGRAGLTQPRAGANVVKRTKLAVDGDAVYTRARYQYRRGPGAVEHDIPLPNLTKADGTPVTYYPVRVDELGDHAVWNAVDTLGSTGGVVQVRAQMFPDADNVSGYTTQWVTINVDPNGDGAAGSEAGPGSVNLLTGDFQLSSTDADEFGMSVSRVASSREPTDGWVPQGERLTSAQQQVSDVGGFVADGVTLGRATTRGQGTSTDSLELHPTRADGDTFAAIGSHYNMALGTKPGKRYRVTAWIYVPASAGLSFPDGRGGRIVGYTYNGQYNETRSTQVSFVDGWQELTVDVDVPANATQAFFRLYNGHVGGSGKVVYWDNISVREVVAPFGPQWRGGATDGMASSGYETLSFPSPEVAKISLLGGDHLTFGRSTSGQFFPEPGAEDLSLVKVDDSTYRLAELDGGYTEFTAQGGVFVASSTRTDEDSSTSRYVYDSTDNRTLLKKVINPVEPGVGDCTTPVPAPGCEVMEYQYATQTTATGAQLGDYVDRVIRVTLWSWNPEKSTVDSIEVAAYAYDSQGRLAKVWDPRLTSALVTHYDYDGAGRVTKITPPGELPWMFDYGRVGADPDAGRLLRVRRAALKPGSRDQTDGEIATNVVYHVPLTRSSGGPHDMDAAAVARWAQKDIPTDVTAIFAPEGPPGTNDATNTKPGRDGYGLATVHYLNANGQETNTATPGGHVDSQTFDEHGNEVWSLESTNRALALGELPDAEAKTAELNLPADSAQRAQLLSTVSRYSPDGLDLVDTLGPVTRVVLDEPLAAAGKPTLPAGSQVIARGHATNIYDEGKPDGAAYHLITTETSGARVEGYPADADQRTTRYAYNAAKGGVSGWTLKTATSTTADAGPGGTPVTTHAVFDAAGKVLRSYGLGATGTDPGTTITIYYTAGANPDDTACGGKPQWAGQPCVTRFGGAVTGHDPARMTGELPIKRVLAYTRSGDPAVVGETAGGKTRTTSSFYDGADRLTKVELTSDDGSAALPAVQTEYDPVSGDATVTRSGGKTVKREFDLLGRLLSYTDADGGTTRTEFDRNGKPTKVSDNTGHTTYTYDRRIEPRGMLTSVTDSVAGTFGARYSPDGQLVEMTYPGGMTRRDTLDATFVPTGRSYVRGSDNQVIYAETVTHNSHGEQVRHDYTGGSKAYGYDRHGRLTSVQQVTASQCTTRVYRYDNRTNRTSKRTYGSGVGGGCRDDADPDADEVHTYDTADRTTDPGYTYDAFGRTTTLPTGMTNTFYANDLVATQQLGDTRQAWTLDPIHRLRGWTTEKLVNGAWSNASSKLNHYGDDSDEPRWIVEDTTLGSITRNVSGPDADLVATTTATGDVRLQLTNLHGDIAATIDPALTTPEFYSYDEFGTPATGQADLRYGWLGGKQRSGEALGDTILMGVRLYSPALGRFLTVDPEPGGNDNAYEYCSADPVNCTDLDGRLGIKLPSFKKVMNTIGKVASVASMIPGPIGVAAGLIGAGAYAAAGNWKEAAWALAGAAAAVVGAGAAVKGARVAVAAVRASGKAQQWGSKAAKAVRSLGRGCGRKNSFTPDTPVLMANGTHVAISDVVVGDYVMATDPITGDNTAQPVVDVIVGTGTKHLIALGLAGGDDFVATAEHPMWVQGRGWVEAKAVKAGAQFVSPSGPVVEVVAVRDLGWVNDTAVYNLNVGNVHTFSVGTGSDQSVLVHNISVPAGQSCPHGIAGGTKFSPLEKAEVYYKNRRKNGGKLRCEECGKFGKPSKKSKRGVKPKQSEMQADHKTAKSKGGPGCAKCNGQGLCRRCNRKKSNR